MATSTVPTVTAALIAALRAAPGLNGVYVSDGPPPRSVLESEDDLVVILDTDGQQAYAAMDLIWDAYTIRCAVSSLGDDATACGTRAFALLAEIEAIVRAANLAPPALGITGLTLTMVGEFNYTKRIDPNNELRREGRVEFGIEAQAYLA